MAIPRIGAFRIGDGNLASKGCRRRCARVAGSGKIGDLLIDLAIDTADEKAGHTGDAINGFALGQPCFEAGHEGLCHRPIGRDRKQQRDVDVQAFGDQLGDGRDARRGSGHLDHQIGSTNFCPQPLGLGDGRIGLMRKIGRHL